MPYEKTPACERLARSGSSGRSRGRPGRTSWIAPGAGRLETMAALLRHGLFKTSQLTNGKYVLGCSYATKAEKKKGIDRKIGPKIESAASSLAAKGFLRPQKEYNPPANLEQRLSTILEKCLGTTDNSIKLDEVNKKYKLLNSCFEEFQHGIPNSLLHTIQTVSDVKKFYATPVDVTTPLDKLKSIDLPENLHIQYEPHRFHPDTDTKFQGITAFPRRSTLVTSLKYKKKYKGHEQATVWPYS